MKQIEMLKDHPDFPAGPAEAFAGEGGHLHVSDGNASGLGDFQAVDAAQQGAFTGSAEANDSKNLALFNFEVDVAEGGNRLILGPVCFGYVLKFNNGRTHGRSPSFRKMRSTINKYNTN